MPCILLTMMAVFPFFPEMGKRGACSVKYAPYQSEHIVKVHVHLRPYYPCHVVISYPWRSPILSLKDQLVL